MEHNDKYYTEEASDKYASYERNPNIFFGEDLTDDLLDNGKTKEYSRNPNYLLGDDLYDGYGSTAKAAHFEQSSIFRNNLTSYRLDTGRFQAHKYNLLSSDIGGLPLDWNKREKTIYIDSSDTHTVVIGATGSKKSRLIAMPSVYILGDAGESMIISDPKAEIYKRTASFLKGKGYDIHVVNIRQPNRGSAWNPLFIPYQFYIMGEIDRACEFVNDIAVNLMLVDMSVKDPYWDYSACNLFFGLVLLLFKICKEKNLSNEYVSMANLLILRREMFSGDSIYDISNSAKHSVFWKYVKDDVMIASNLMGIVDAPERTMTSILSTFDQKMRCFVIQPNLVGMLSHNSISLETIGDKKTVVFLIIPDEKTAYHKLITLFIKQSYEYMIYNAQSKGDSKMAIRVNYLLDEFSSLPTIADFPSMITAARSRNIRFTLIVQSKHQLIQRYKEETETILSNCSNWIFLTSREITILKEISELCGVDRNRKELVTVSFLQHLDKNAGEALILSGRLYPYKAHLADIDFFDKGKSKELELPLHDYLTNSLIKSFQELFNLEEEKDFNANEIDLRTKLEEKFDKMVAPLDDVEEKKSDSSVAEEKLKNGLVDSTESSGTILNDSSEDSEIDFTDSPDDGETDLNDSDQGNGADLERLIKHRQKKKYY